MQEFYRRALYAFVLILLADAFLAAVLVERSFLSQSLLPSQESNDRAVHWRRALTSIPWNPRFIRVDETAHDGLRFDLNLPADGSDLNVSADLRTKINEVLKSEVGMTFTGYLNKLRLTEAARMLTEKSGMTVAEVAFAVGYANASYFSKLFKEAYRCTPKAFRTVADQTDQLSGPIQETVSS